MKNKFIGISDKSFLDLFSISHFALGFFVGLILFIFQKKIIVRPELFFIIGFVVLILWEAFEQLMRFINHHYPELAKSLIKIFPDCWFAEESLLNITGDLFTGLIGLIVIFIIIKSIS